MVTDSRPNVEAALRRFAPMWTSRPHFPNAARRRARLAPARRVTATALSSLKGSFCQPRAARRRHMPQSSRPGSGSRNASDPERVVQLGEPGDHRAMRGYVSKQACANGRGAARSNGMNGTCGIDETEPFAELNGPFRAERIVGGRVARPSAWPGRSGLSGREAGAEPPIVLPWPRLAALPDAANVDAAPAALPQCGSGVSPSASRRIAITRHPSTAKSPDANARVIHITRGGSSMRSSHAHEDNRSPPVSPINGSRHLFLAPPTTHFLASASG